MLQTPQNPPDFLALVFGCPFQQKLLRMSTGCQKDRNTNRQTYRQTDRKTERLFSLVVKTKVVQNVNRMSKVSQTGRKIYSAPDRQTK